MMRIYLICCFISLASCAGKKAESRQAEQPTEVSGGFGLTMQCNVINRGSDDAASSSVGCLVFNDDGSPYTGSITETSAEVVSSTGQVIKSSQIISGENASGFSVLVEVSGLKPSDAATIRVSGVFDGKSLILVASLKEFATTCTQDMNLYVDINSSEKNRLCSATEKCKTIKQALSLLPDIINCNVTIAIAKGTYKESIRINDKVVRRVGRIQIQGESRPGENVDFQTIIMNDTSNYDNQGATRGLLITGLSNGGSAAIPVLELSNLTFLGDSSTDHKKIEEEGFFGVVSHSSNLLLKNVKISGYKVAINSPTSSAIQLEDISITGAQTGISLRSPSSVNLAGEMTLSGIDKTKGMGIMVSDANQFFLGRPGNLLKSIEIDNFYQAMRLQSVSVNFSGGEKFEIKDVHHGIMLFENSALTFPPFPPETDGTNKVEISINNFTGSGLFLSNSTVRDGDSTDWPAQAAALKHSLKIEGSPDGYMMWATDDSTIDLTQTTFDFCFKSYLAKLSTPWNSTIPSSYAIAVDSDSEARFSWATSPFKFGETCSSPVTPQKLYIKRYKYRFPATMSGEAKICPAGYFLQSDDHCYGSLGQARFTPPAGTASDHNFFGVLESDSRIDHLPSTNP